MLQGNAPGSLAGDQPSLEPLGLILYPVWPQETLLDEDLSPDEMLALPRFVQCLYVFFSLEKELLEGRCTDAPRLGGSDPSSRSPTH